MSTIATALLEELARDPHAIARLRELVGFDAATTTSGDPDELLNTTEACAHLRCKRQRIYNLVSEKRLTVHKDGSRNLYRRSDLDQILVIEPADR